MALARLGTPVPLAGAIVCARAPNFRSNPCGAIARRVYLSRPSGAPLCKLSRMSPGSNFDTRTMALIRLITPKQSLNCRLVQLISATPVMAADHSRPNVGVKLPSRKLCRGPRRHPHAGGSYWRHPRSRGFEPDGSRPEERRPCRRSQARPLRHGQDGPERASRGAPPPPPQAAREPRPP